MEKMLVTQALDERDLLVKKITDKINKASFVDMVKVNEDKVMGKHITREEFEQQAKANLQQIEDLIDRYQRIDAAIVASNASATIETSYGTFTVAAAISLRNRLRDKNIRLNGSNTLSVDTGADFEGRLYNKMQKEYVMNLDEIERKNRQLQTTAENMRLSILGKDTKVKDDKPLEVVEAYVKENTTQLVDPLGIQKKMEYLQEKKATLLAELETQIKVSNATTLIEF